MNTTTKTLTSEATLTEEERAHLEAVVSGGHYDVGDDGEPYTTHRGGWIHADEARRLLSASPTIAYTEESWSHAGRTAPAVVVAWDDIEGLLGHGHRGTSEEDRAIVAALLASGAPAWVADAEGDIDDHGYALIQPEAAARSARSAAAATEEAAARSARSAVAPANHDGLYTDTLDGVVVVRDPAGGIWWPTRTMGAGSDASAHAEVLAQCLRDPMSGRWAD